LGFWPWGDDVCPSVGRVKGGSRAACGVAAATPWGGGASPLTAGWLLSWSSRPSAAITRGARALAAGGGTSGRAIGQVQTNPMRFLLAVLPLQRLQRCSCVPFSTPSPLRSLVAPPPCPPPTGAEGCFGGPGRHALQEIRVRSAPPPPPPTLGQLKQTEADDEETDALLCIPQKVTPMIPTQGIAFSANQTTNSCTSHVLECLLFLGKHNTSLPSRCRAQCTVHSHSSGGDWQQDGSI